MKRNSLNLVLYLILLTPLGMIVSQCNNDEEKSFLQPQYSDMDSEAMIPLEDSAFILNHHKIYIPGIEHAYNPSILNYKTAIFWPLDGITILQI